MSRLNQKWAVFAIAAISVFMMSFDSTLIPIALFDIGAGVGVKSPAHLSWISTTQTIAMAACVVAVGRIGDRIGRRRIFMFGLGMYVIGALIGGTSNTLAQLLVGRTVQGAGAACVFPSSLGLVLAAWPEDETTRAITAWTAVGAVAGALSPSVGSAMVDHWSWRSTFLVHLVTVLPALFFARKVLPDTSRRSDASLPDMVGVVLVALFLGPLALTLAQVREWGLGDTKIQLALLLAVLVLPLLVWRCRTHPAPVVEPRMLHLRTYRLVMGLCIVVATGIFANYVMMPQYLKHVWGYDTFGVGMAIVPFSVSASLAALGVGRLAKRYDEKWILIAGLAVMGGSTVWLAVATGSNASYWAAFLPGVIGTGVGGWAAALSMLNSLGARDLDNTNYGVGVGVLMTARQVGSLTGIATTLGFLGTAGLTAADAESRIHTVWWWLTPLFFVGIAASLAIPGRARVTAR